jgi:hypothetical protein
MKKLTISKLAITVASLATLALSTAAWAGPSPLSHSEYTPLGHSCKVLWHAAQNEPLPDSFRSVCPGRDGMRVTLEGHDARSWIGLLHPGQSTTTECSSVFGQALLGCPVHGWSGAISTPS